MNLVERLKELMDNEARSCSMDYGCITPEYVQRAWGGRVAIEDITQGLTELWKQGCTSWGFTEIRTHGNKDLRG